MSLAIVVIPRVNRPPLAGYRHFRVASVVRCLAVMAIVSVSGCAPKRMELPTAPGAPSQDALAAYEDAVRECRGARTIEVTLGLSGRAGDTRLRGNLDAGFESPERVRLEMRGPIGRQIFILVAPSPEATLYLPRDNRVLRGAQTTQVVEALTGLSLSGGELRSLVGGCGFGVAEPSDGRAIEGEWMSVHAGTAVTYLRKHEDRWRITAAVRSGLTIQYSGFLRGRAEVIRLQAPASKADVTVRVSDLSINGSLHPDVFKVDIPAGAEPLTLEELRSAGPLGRQ